MRLHVPGYQVHPIALEMMDYEPVLPYLVDAMGWCGHAVMHTPFASAKPCPEQAVQETARL